MKVQKLNSIKGDAPPRYEPGILRDGVHQSQEPAGVGDAVGVNESQEIAKRLGCPKVAGSCWGEGSIRFYERHTSIRHDPAVVISPDDKDGDIDVRAFLIQQRCQRPVDDRRVETRYDYGDSPACFVFAINHGQWLQARLSVAPVVSEYPVGHGRSCAPEPNPPCPSGCHAGLQIHS